MKPSVTLATCQTPRGATLECIAHDTAVYLYLDRQPICSSRAYEPEAALARCGCNRISQYRNPHILLAGLGLGHCLHETLTLAPSKATVVLSEPLKPLIEWNRTLLGDDHRLALQDERLTVHPHPITTLLKKSATRFDAIMISDDPGLIRAASNTLRACAAHLNPKGILCVKAARDDAARIRGIIRTCHLHTQVLPVGARPGARTRTHAIIAAAARPDLLPETT